MVTRVLYAKNGNLISWFNVIALVLCITALYLGTLDSWRNPKGTS